MAASRRALARPRASLKTKGATALGEWEAIDVLTRHLARVPSPGVRVGIGDDAAVFDALGGGKLVVSIDTAVEHVHFERRWLSLAEIAARAFHAAVSDLAAMGATPIAALCALNLPRGFSRANLNALARSQARAGSDLGCPVVGGNISRAEALCLTTTVLGSTPRPLLRSGARPGDEIWLLGEVGMASVGLLALQSGGAEGGGRAVAACVRAWRKPRARIVEALSLRGAARACIDVSDGLAADLGHLARASGVRVELENDWLAAVLSPELRAACKILGREPLQHALHGGEDYALVATGSARVRPSGTVPIGHVRAGRGVFVRDGNGKTERLATLGHTHRM